jgi:hypothetical protein
MLCYAFNIITQLFYINQFMFDLKLSAFFSSFSSSYHDSRQKQNSKKYLFVLHFVISKTFANTVAIFFLNA